VRLDLVRQGWDRDVPSRYLRGAHMRLPVSTGPVRVIGYGKWEDVIGEPANRKDGSPSEYIVVVDDDGETERCTLTADVNGDRPKDLAMTCLVGELVRRDGKLKLRVSGFQAAPQTAKA
jgi:hypothetical protein